jgi:hypothetical protein
MPVTKLNFYFKSGNMQTLSIKYNPHNRPAVPIKPVLTAGLQRELNQLANSLRTQVRNVIAVNNWLQQKEKTAAIGQEFSLNWPGLQNNEGEVLSFRFVSSPEAFKLFADTMLRKSFFLHYYAEVNPEEQVLKTRISFSRLPAWEQELSIIFESITIAVYLETLLYHQPSKLLKRKAS